MKTSNTRTRKFSSTVGKMVMALVFASMIGGVFIAPAFGDDDDRRGGYYGQGRYEHGRYEHNRYEHNRRGYYQPRTYYSEHAYTPPLDVYVPMPSPGVSLVFPIHVR